VSNSQRRALKSTGESSLGSAGAFTIEHLQHGPVDLLGAGMLLRNVIPLWSSISLSQKETGIGQTPLRKFIRLNRKRYVIISGKIVSEMDTPSPSAAALRASGLGCDLPVYKYRRGA